MIDAPPTKQPTQPAPTSLVQRRADDAFLDFAGVVFSALLIVLTISLLLGGALLLAILQPEQTSAIASMLLGEKTFWYMTRASAFVAYGLLWWSMVLGLVITNRFARIWPGGPTVGDLHEHASLLGLGFAVLHAAVLLGDHYIGYTITQLLVPFATTDYRPLWTGIGQIGLYLLAIVTLTFYVRRWIGTRAWRFIHYLSFLVFVMAMVHGIWSGSDTGAVWAQWIYVGSGVSVLILTIYRVLVARRRTLRAAGTRSL